MIWMYLISAALKFSFILKVRLFLFFMTYHTFPISFSWIYKYNIKMSKCIQTLGICDAFERITQLLYICCCMCFSLFVVMFFNSAVTYTFNNTTETETFTIYRDRSQQNIEAHYPNTRVLVVSIDLFHRTSCSHKLH